MIAPVGLLLLIGAVLLIWWLAKQAPGWVVALLGGGLVLLAGFAALVLMYARTESRVVQERQARRTADEVIERSKAEEKKVNTRESGSTVEIDSSDGHSSTTVSNEAWPYRGRHSADDRPHRAPTWNLAIGGLLMIVVAGVGLLVGFVTLSIYLVRKHPALIVLPIFGGLGLVVVLLGFVWLAKDGSSLNEYAEPSAVSASSDADFIDSPQPETRYEVIAPASGGTVTEILVRHNATVEVDEVLLRLENQQLEQARQEKLSAIAATDKQLKDGDESNKVELEITRSAQLAELDSIDRKISHLEIKSPAAGRIGGRNLHNLLSQTLKGGEVILHVFESNTPVDVLTPEPPPWVNTPKSRVDGVDQRMVEIGPYRNPDEYDGELYEKIRGEIDEYALGIPGVEPVRRFPVPRHYINDNIIKAEYVFSRDFTVGRMKQKYVLLAFDHRAKMDIKKMYRDELLQSRLGFAGFGSCLMLMLIGTVYGYLKLDTQTKGYYSGRLKLAAAAAILGVLALAAMLATGGIIS